MKLTVGKVVLFLFSVWLVANFLPIPAHVLEDIENVAFGVSFFLIGARIYLGGDDIGQDGLARYKLEVQQQIASQTCPQCGKADYTAGTYRPQGTAFVMKQLFVRTPWYRVRSPVEYGEDAMTQFICKCCGCKWKIAHTARGMLKDKTAQP
jgi:hypothetical protein